MEKLCSCCMTAVDSESAAILTLGGYGNIKYLCEECDADMNIATRGRDAEQINSAITRLGTRMSKKMVDDTFVLKTMDQIIKEAKARRDAIASGEYDFAEEEESDAVSEEIPEELRVSEEDRARDEKEAEEAKKLEKVISIVSAVIFSAVIGYLIYRFIDVYFL